MPAGETCALNPSPSAPCAPLPAAMTRLPMSAFRRQLRGIPREFPASYPQSPPSHPQFPGPLPAGTQRPGAHKQRDIRTHAQAQARREVLWRMLGRHPETKTRAAYDVSAGRTTRDVAAGPQGVGSVGMDGRRACKSAAWLWVYEHLYGPTDRAIVLLQVCSHTANARMTRTHARARAHAHAHARTHTHTHTREHALAGQAAARRAGRHKAPRMARLRDRIRLAALGGIVASVRLAYSVLLRMHRLPCCQRAPRR